MNTDWGKTNQGGAWASQAALGFKIPPQASLHEILKTHRSLAARVTLLLHSALDTRSLSGHLIHYPIFKPRMPRITTDDEAHAGMSDARSGGVFACPLPSELAVGPSKTPLHSLRE